MVLKGLDKSTDTFMKKYGGSFVSKGGIDSMTADFMRKYGGGSSGSKGNYVCVPSSNKYVGAGSGKGWENEPARHSMSAFGIKSGRKGKEKSKFRSEPFIKAGIGGAFAVARGVGKVKAILDERKQKQKEKEERERQEKEYNDNFVYDGSITPPRQNIFDKTLDSNDFIKNLRKKEADRVYKEAQMKAMQEKESQYARVLEAKRNKAPQESKEQIEKDYASV